MSYESRFSRGGLEFGAGGFIDPLPARAAPATKSAPVVDGDVLTGVACRYGVPHYGKNSSREIFVPGAFARTLASQQAVRLLLDHDESKLLATRADSLILESDDRDLRIRCKVQDTPAGRELKAAVRDGGRMECSVGYLVVESFKRQVEGETVTFITDANLLEVSLVQKGAVPGTSASIRSVTDDPLLQSLNRLDDVLDEKNRAMRLLLESL